TSCRSTRRSATRWSGCGGICGRRSRATISVRPWRNCWNGCSPGWRTEPRSRLKIRFIMTTRMGVRGQTLLDRFPLWLELFSQVGPLCVAGADAVFVRVADANHRVRVNDLTRRIACLPSFLRGCIDLDQLGVIDRAVKRLGDGGAVGPEPVRGQLEPAARRVPQLIRERLGSLRAPLPHVPGAHQFAGARAGYEAPSIAAPLPVAVPRARFLLAADEAPDCSGLHILNGQQPDRAIQEPLAVWTRFNQCVQNRG